MKIVLDEGVPELLAEHLPGHDVQSVRQMGLKGTKNGKLLKAIEEAGFEAFITNDNKMQAGQQLQRFGFATLVLSACNLPVILPHISVLREAVDTCKPGTVQHVECGRFIARGKREL